MRLGWALPLVLTAALGNWGCMTEMVERRASRKGPVPEVGYIDLGKGEIKYSTESYGWVVALRRRSAMRRIRKACKPLKAAVTDEFEREDAEVTYSGDGIEESMNSGLAHYRVHPFMHLVFECVPEAKP